MDFTSKTHRNFSPLHHQATSSSPFNSSSMLFADPSSPFEIPHGFCRSSQSPMDKRPNDHPSPKANPRIHHIPIHIEGRESPDHRSFSPFTPPPNSNFTSDPTQVPVTRARSYSNSSNTNLSRSPSAASEAASHRSFSSASVDSNNNNSSSHINAATSDNNGKKVRQIPITLEYDPHEPSARRSGHSFGAGHSRNTPSPAPQYSSSPRTNSFASGPHVTSIPVNIKRSNNATPFTDAPPHHYQHQNAAPKEAPVEAQTPPAKSPVPPAKQTGPKTAMDLIEEAHEKLAHYRNEIEKFTGERDCKEYRYLDEMLTRLLITCDNIETNGDPNIRTARKGVINAINSCIAFLESKAKGNQPPPEAEESNQGTSLEPVLEDVTCDGENDPSEVATDEPMQLENEQIEKSDEPMQEMPSQSEADKKELMTQERDSSQGEAMQGEQIQSTEAVITSTASLGAADASGGDDVTASSPQEQQVTEALMEQVSQAEGKDEEKIPQQQSTRVEKDEKTGATNDQPVAEGVPMERSDAGQS